MTTGDGVIAASPAAPNYPAGTLVTLTAMPGSGKALIGWIVDGTFRGWRSPLTITMGTNHLVSAAFAPLPVFTGVAVGNPYRNAIAQLAARGVVRGYGDGSFGPADPTLRAQGAALIVRAMGWEGETHPSPFADRCDARGCVDDDLWRSVGTLAYRKVARGFGDGTYAPFDDLAHLQAISLIARAMVANGYWVQQPDPGHAALYPNVPDSSGARADLATYVFYAGDVYGRPRAQAWGDYATPAGRGWFAESLWRALDGYFGVDRVP